MAYFIKFLCIFDRYEKWASEISNFGSSASYLKFFYGFIFFEDEPTDHDPSELLSFCFFPNNLRFRLTYLSYLLGLLEFV